MTDRLNRALQAILKAGLPEQQIILVHGCEARLYWSSFSNDSGESLRCHLRAFALGRANPLTMELPLRLPDNVDAIAAMMRIHETRIVHATNRRISGQI
jgi:hypothetical protein